jgi:hypothetical protein
VKLEIKTYDEQRDGSMKHFAGRIYGDPIPLNPSATTFVPLGNISFGVEYRYHSDNEAGVSVHVVDGRSGTEYLRFDCFEEREHYHYIFADQGFHDRFFLDTASEGDPVAWSLDRMRTRLVPMMIRAGAGPDLIDDIDPGELQTAVEQVARLTYGAVSLATGADSKG